VGHPLAGRRPALPSHDGQEQINEPAYGRLRDQMMSNKLITNIRLKFLNKYGLIYVSIQFFTHGARESPLIVN